jgi:C1A family cysteine protease
VLAKQGAAPESLWPYVLSKCFTKPTAAAATAALEHQALAYKRVDNTKLSDLLAALAEGLPIAFGSMLYENFYSLSKRFEVPAPKGKALGGHAMLICGYNQSRKAFLVRNSWGVGWGDKGYITNRNLTDDCWCLVKVEL